MNKDQVRERILESGIVAVVRASSPDEARFAADAVAEGGIPIVEITMTVPGAIEVIREVVKALPHVVVGAGTVLDAETGRRCLDAGAEFLVSPGLDVKTVELATRNNVFMMAGAMTPTEVLQAWAAGSDFVKIFPCGQVGGPEYIKALKGPLPGIPLVPTGGVNLKTAAAFMLAGSAALGVGNELVLKEAMTERTASMIHDAARRFVEIVREIRHQMTGSGAARAR
ncbi:MAG TPA: bifunctional 4-hydroxy-2-oxoglutarate aldolase/2-dehydro-3-deoxy-phosphogluconate aldolase [Terriglobia bacterium]|jgi:2-dehydro-3-deoxyphosphogluconate aldolase/(4S)-4-hydroxy-2-oxoglutarate aldolase|nr:bifunctional 4-hydroxy-2-oxoglutarate aldolase/2-dehydro-3-deoxy-phosphogluconate aldolase [Terriglobia bacterium]